MLFVKSNEILSEFHLLISIMTQLPTLSNLFAMGFICKFLFIFHCRTCIWWSFDRATGVNYPVLLSPWSTIVALSIESGRERMNGCRDSVTPGGLLFKSDAHNFIKLSTGLSRVASQISRNIILLTIPTNEIFNRPLIVHHLSCFLFFLFNIPSGVLTTIEYLFFLSL